MFLKCNSHSILAWKNKPGSCSMGYLGNCTFEDYDTKILTCILTKVLLLFKTRKKSYVEKKSKSCDTEMIYLFLLCCI